MHIYEISKQMEYIYPASSEFIDEFIEPILDQIVVVMLH
ncbi:hypothetical protein CUMW_031480 [Citrus unshiu]|nr:hypothetical protein CUMW_031480 [Citrus unshiu]